MKAMVMGLLVLGGTGLSWSAHAASKPAKISYFKGEVNVLRKMARYRGQDGKIRSDAPWVKAKKGLKVSEGDAIRTGKKSRVELRIPDGSRVRLGASSLVELNQAQLSGDQTRNVTFTMWVGRLWANVAKRMGGGSRFEVKTQNAVAGVRGTSFAVMARADLSSVVKVYIGSVGVRASPGESEGRQQVPGPQRIDKAQWEEVILTAMKQVRVGKLGRLQPAEDLLDQGSDAEWAKWNQGRDSKIP